MQKKILVWSVIFGISIFIFFCFYKFPQIKSGLISVASLTAPFILGFAIAFLLNGPMMFIENKLMGKLNWKKENKRRVSAICAVIIGLVVVGAFLALLIPQLMESLYTLIKKSPQYLDSFQKMSEEMMIRYDINFKEITAIVGEQPDFISKLTDFFSSALPEMLKFSYSFASGMLNVLLGIMAGLYILLDKEKFVLHVRKANYAIFPKRVADYMVKVSRTSADIFNNFIIGKAIDSLIIGILCYIGMNIISLPYAVLLSVIVGVTNMIPVFGPFIGAVPGMLILLIINPLYSVYFALFILVLQQFDGNILGPLILGDKLGLPSLWILFAVCVGGGLFGIVGMFVGVPIFAVIYTLSREWIIYRLKKKNLDIT